MSQVIYRNAGEQDAQAIALLHTQSWQFCYRDSLDADYLQHSCLGERRQLWKQRLSSDNPQQKVIVAEDTNTQTLVGFVCAYAQQHAEYGHLIDNLHVSQNYQGQGIGKHLLGQVVRQLAPSTLPVYLIVVTANVPAVNFYQTLGAKRLSDYLWQAPDHRAVPSLIMQWPTPDSLLRHSPT